METLKITKFTATNTNKEGEPLTGKFGPYWRVGLQAEGKEGWINGFISGSQKPEDWTGKEVTLELFEEEWQGKKQLKFKLPKKQEAALGEMQEALERIQNAQVRDHIILQQILDAVKVKPKNFSTPSNTTAFENGEVPPEDLPF